MKKPNRSTMSMTLLILALLVLTLLTLTACGTSAQNPSGGADPNEGTTSAPGGSSSAGESGGTTSGSGSGEQGADAIPDIIRRLCEGVELPDYEVTKLDDESFQAFAFIPPAKGLTGYHADALINSIPHSLVVVHTANGDADALAKQILANADPVKWICVSAAAKQVAYSSHYIVLVMSSPEAVKAIMANAPTALNDSDVTYAAE